jgi:hypothetical protein
MAGVLVSSSFLVSYIPPKLDSRQLSINQIGNTTTTFGGYQQTKFIFKNHLNAVLYVQKVKLGKPAMIMIGFDSSKEPKSRTLDLYLTNDSLKIHDLHISLQRVSGQYMTYATIPGNGLWHVYAELGIDDFNQSQAAFNVQI